MVTPLGALSPELQYDWEMVNPLAQKLYSQVLSDEPSYNDLDVSLEEVRNLINDLVTG